MDEPHLLDTPAAGPAAARGGAVRTVGYLVGVAITVGSAAVLFRQLGVDGTGRYVLILSIVNLAGAIVDAGLSSIGVRELSLYGTGEDRTPLLANLLGLRLAFTSAGMAGACLYAVIIGLSGHLVLATVVAGVGTLLANVQNMYATTLMADLALVRVTALDLARQVLTAAGIVIAALAGAGLLGFIAVAPCVGLVVLAATVRVVGGAVPLRPRAEGRVWRTLLRQTLPFALAVAVNAVYFRLAILLVDLLSSERQTGYFGASFRVVEVLILLPSIAVTAALPIFSRAARDDQERLRYGLGLVAQAMAIAGVGLALALAPAAPTAIKVVAGDGFDGSIPVLRLHAVALMLSFAAAPFAFALISMRKHREVVTFNLAAIAVLVVALLLLVPDHGARGGAAATIAGESVQLGFGAWFVARSGLRVDLAWVPRVAVAGAVAVVPAALLPAIPAAAAALVVYAGALLATRAVPDEVLQMLPGRT